MSSVAAVFTVLSNAPLSGNKHALHGFFNSLRQDLALQGRKGVSITLCILGFIDTKNAFEGTKCHPVEKTVRREPADECALAMMKGAALRKRQMYFPWYLSIVETAHLFFPNFVESAIQVVSNEKPLEDLLKCP